MYVDKFRTGHAWVPINNTDNIVSSFIINDLNEGRFKFLRFINIKIRSWLKMKIFVNIYEDPTFRALSGCTDRYMVPIDIDINLGVNIFL